jgi:hypothetical protein
MTSSSILKEKHMILLFFKKLYEFVAAVMPIQMSTVGHSVGPQKEQWIQVNAFKAYFNGPAAAIRSQNFCAEY